MKQDPSLSPRCLLEVNPWLLNIFLSQVFIDLSTEEALWRQEGPYSKEEIPWLAIKNKKPAASEEGEDSEDAPIEMSLLAEIREKK